MNDALKRNVFKEILDLIEYANQRNIKVLEVQATMGDMMTICAGAGPDYITIYGYPFRVGQQIALICR